MAISLYSPNTSQERHVFHSEHRPESTVVEHRNRTRQMRKAAEISQSQLINYAFELRLFTLPIRAPRICC